MIKKLLRISELDEETQTYTMSAYLIAQLGKNYKGGANLKITGQQLLQAAMDTIKEIQHMAGGMVVFLEAEENEKLLHFYEKENGFGVIIAGAGMAAALAGVLAAHTTLPVIGVPLKSAVLEGTDALLATVMMPSGIPVATVAIDGSKNAAYLAAEIIALSDESLAEKIAEDRKKQSEAVLKKDAGIQEKIKEL